MAKKRSAKNSKSPDNGKSADNKISGDRPVAPVNAEPSGGNRSAGNDKSAERKRSALSVILLILLLLIILLLLLFVADKAFDLGIFGKKGGNSGVKTEFVDTDTSGLDGTAGASNAGIDSLSVFADSAARAARAADSLARLADSLARVASVRGGRDAAALRAAADSAARAARIADSLARAAADSLAKADSLARAAAASLAKADSIAESMLDSLIRADSLAKADSLARLFNPCARDTLLPWVTPDPSGGLHRKAVAVKLNANKKCVVEWSFDGRDWRVYDGSPVNINKAATLFYRAADSCGRKMNARSKRYEFDMTDRSGQCPQDMEYVKAGGKEFCVDAYEWPNRKGVVPNSYVSLYQAMDSCFSMRKRLCSSEEWTAACAGPGNWKYLYGDSYEGNACVARDSAVHKSGSRPECRGYYAVFDMSGNLGEWTSTPATQDRSFNNVMGGFWASGTQSRCADARYSYFPQNRHNPVGFRCCRDTSPQRDEPKPKGSGR